MDILKKYTLNISLVLDCEKTEDAKKIIQPILDEIEELQKTDKILEYTITEWPPKGTAKTIRKTRKQVAEKTKIEVS